MASSPDIRYTNTRLQKSGLDARHGRAPPSDRLHYDHQANITDGDVLLRPPFIGAASRSSSPDSFISRPNTPSSFTSSAGSVRTNREVNTPTSSSKQDVKKKRNWFGRSKHESEEDQGPSTWIAGHEGKVPYDVEDLLNGRPVGELWDNNGDCLIHLSSRQVGRSPSFRVQSAMFASSHVLTGLVTSDGHLYIASVDQADESTRTETFVVTRNLFALLMGQSLVATQRTPSVFNIFMDVSRLLKLYNFSNVDGSTYGTVPTSSFDYYIDELGLADVRMSREKTIEGIVLGEAMKNVKLYNEAFTHAVGKYDAIVKLGSPKFQLVSQVSLNRLSRAASNLQRYALVVTQVLGDLEFPSIFSGIMASKTASERKHVNFDEWRESFLVTRKFFMGFYKQRYKNWPPKAPSKHSAGLNRLVLQEIFQDLCAVYDLVVDRSSLTHRIGNGAAPDPVAEPRASAIRQVFGEYDRSSPPVKPPIPFDLPNIPSLKTTRPDFGKDEKKDARLISKDLKDDETSKILKGSYSEDAVAIPFTTAFEEFERKRAHSKNIKQITDNRVGHWIFIYAVLQVLPMVVVDAPGIRYVSDVEYFLCQPPRSGVPWAKDGAGGVAGDTARLPADMAEPGIEGVYHRSHCWIMAERWKASLPSSSVPLALRPRADPQPQSRAVAGERDTGYRAPSSSGHAPPILVDGDPMADAQTNGGVGRERKERPVSFYDPTKTFDAILASAADEKKKKKKK